MKSFLKGIKSFFDPLAWVLIIVGSMLLSSRITASSDWIVNLPELVTVLQLAGGIFILTGFCMVCSQVFWPQVLASEMLILVRDGNTAAGLVIFGLKVFAGLSMIAFAIWLALTTTGLAGVHNG
jgi:hypothetical protein